MRLNLSIKSEFWIPWTHPITISDRPTIWSDTEKGIVLHGITLWSISNLLIATQWVWFWLSGRTGNSRPFRIVLSFCKIKLNLEANYMLWHGANWMEIISVLQEVVRALVRKTQWHFWHKHLSASTENEIHLQTYPRRRHWTQKSLIY